jgi:hypothetical protein
MYSTLYFLIKGTSTVEENHKQEKRLTRLLRHIHLVQEGCQVIADKLTEEGEEDFARRLIANSMIHDNSKFHGIEWEYLHEEVKEENSEVFKLALSHHISTNPHHPEYWPSGITEMPRLFLCEMVADWHARSAEFGTDLREWIKEKACKKYEISCNCKVYKQIKDFLDLLLERSFK